MPLAPPDLEAAPHDAPPPRRRRATTRFGAVFGGVTLLTAVGLTVAGLLLASAIGSWEGCAFTTVPDRPGKGTDSLRLPVEVTPRTDLADGQTAFVTSDAFAPHEVVGVAVCLREADVGEEGVDACDTTQGARFAVDAEGRLAAAFPVPRVITVAGVAHDCASEPGRCLVVAAHVRDYDRSGGQPVSFAPDLGPADLTPAGARPKSVRLPITARPAGPVAAGTRIEVTATGFVPGEPVLVAPCTVEFLTFDPWDACAPAGQSAALLALMGDVSKVTDHAGPDGSFTTTVPAPARIEVGLGTGMVVPCATAGSCGIVVAAAADLTRSAYLPVALTG